MPVQRRLAAILAADVAGYARLMGVDEEDTRARFNATMSEVVAPAVAQHRSSEAP
jgi:class 3 adenylate cyclase